MAEVDIYLLDWEYNKIGLIERFSTFIWTDRHRSYGDFQLTIPINYYPNSIFPGRFLHIPDSDSIMMIETTTKTENSLGEDSVLIEGRSFEAIFENRVTAMYASGAPYRRTDGPGWIIRHIVHRICVEGTGFSPRDVIPRFSVRNPPASIIGHIDVEIPPEPLYKTVKDLTDADRLGMRVFFDPDSRSLEFASVRGRDRTAGSSNPLIFSPEYDNLFNTKFLRSVVDYKNVAYVMHNDRTGILEVTKRGLDTKIGFNRRVLLVDANDIQDPTEAQLRERGYNALEEHNYRTMFDGEIPPHFGEAFELGDHIEIRDFDGENQETAVVEEIVRTFDRDGWRTYPTLETLDADIS